MAHYEHIPEMLDDIFIGASPERTKEIFQALGEIIFDRSFPDYLPKEVELEIYQLIVKLKKKREIEQKEYYAEHISEVLNSAMKGLNPNE